MYSEGLSEIYDHIYRGRGKDYATESSRVVDMIRKRSPEARSLLDVACGTGSHLDYFAKEFECAEGVEGSAGMISRAKDKLPGVTVTKADMMNFDLGRKFSAVTCMFAIPHLSSVEELNAAVRCFAQHLETGGVLVVEPWRSPDNFTPGYVAGDVVREGEYTIARVSHSESEGRAVRMQVHYVVAAPRTGARHFEETHSLTLFTRDEYEEAFRLAGCEPEHVVADPWECGMFVGVRRGD